MVDEFVDVNDIPERRSSHLKGNVRHASNTILTRKQAGNAKSTQHHIIYFTAII